MIHSKKWSNDIILLAAAFDADVRNRRLVLEGAIETKSKEVVSICEVLMGDPDPALAEAARVAKGCGNISYEELESAGDWGLLAR